MPNSIGIIECYYGFLFLFFALTALIGVRVLGERPARSYEIWFCRRLRSVCVGATPCGCPWFEITVGYCCLRFGRSPRGDGRPRGDRPYEIRYRLRLFLTLGQSLRDCPSVLILLGRPRVVTLLIRGIAPTVMYA